MRKRNKISERKPSRGDNFYNGSGGSAPKLPVSCSIRDRCKNHSGSGFLCSEILFRFLIYILPGVLFFSYWPVIGLGANESMNFELSLPLLWLVAFDVLVFVMMARRKLLFKGWRKKWVWLLLPVWLSLSVIWSLNPLRGVLTVGIVWLLYLAGDGIWSLRGLFKGASAREKFWKWFFGTALAACGWCWLQCVLDLCGVSRDYTLMCAGCGYGMFGFPHPNGFAIEPQFMGNLLLAPAMIAIYMYMKTKAMLPSDTLKAARPSLRSSGSIALVFILLSTLFLTFSRGAIYAFVIGMAVMTIWMGVREKSWRVLQVWGVTVAAFVCALGAQGVMAASSPTNDTFQSGVAKVLNHLSLGVVDVREAEVVEDVDVVDEVAEAEPVAEEEAVFDGYVAESTDTRVRLSGAAVEVWRQDLATAMFGVGLGGAGQALYINGLSPAPKEIVQNEYASLLLETGVVGVVLVGFSLVLVVRAVWKSPLRVVLLSLLVAYGVSLCFFSGLPNALQIYLLPGVIYVLGLKTAKV